jgi:transcriptional regulator with XRE-family HTH domain
MAVISELASRRRAERITLEDLSRRAGIEQTRISRFENGKLEPNERDLRILEQSIDDVLFTRKILQQTAESAGLSLVGVKLHA